MDLLPKHHGEFRQKEYWDDFFRKRGKKAFEWYGEYAELCGVLHKYIKPKDKVLVVGCGNSTLSSNLYDVGYHDVVNIDISDKVIDQMSRQHRHRRPHLAFKTADVKDMKFAQDNEFTVVLDKGTLDAIFTDDSAEVTTQIDRMLAEIDRVLRHGGRFVCFTLLQPHILQHVVEYFCDLGWPLRLVRCREAEDSKPVAQRQFPVFALIATKFKKLSAAATAAMQPVLEMSLSNQGQLTRLRNVGDLVESVRGIQQFAAVSAGSAKKLFGGQDDLSLDLVSPSSITGTTTTPRYSLFMVNNDDDDDDDLASGNKVHAFSVFIVPQGREAEWLFSTTEGRRQLAGSAGCKRMAVVHLHRDQNYESMQQIQTELSGYAMELSPPDLPVDFRIPFLSLGGSGHRVERCRGKSNLTGEFVVEDVSVEDDGASKSVVRRLILFANPKVIQSEVGLKLSAVDEKKERMTVDASRLACAHHSAMVASLGLLDDDDKLRRRCLVVGLGGGTLSAFIARNFSRVDVEAVEIDPAIVRVAEEHFGLVSGPNLKIVIRDGLLHLKESAERERRYHVIMLDVDNKDSSVVGLSCPSKPFLEPDALRFVKRCLRPDDGIFVVNLSCRDPVLRSQVLTNIRNAFHGATTVSYRVPQEIYEVLLCCPASVRDKDQVLQAFEAANANLGQDLLNLEEATSQLHIF